MTEVNALEVQRRINLARVRGLIAEFGLDEAEVLAPIDHMDRAIISAENAMLASVPSRMDDSVAMNDALVMTFAEAFERGPL